jgi:hypothetical protein
VSPKVAFSVLVCVAASLASAQNIKVGFPDDGDRQVWISAGLPTEAPGDSDGVHALKPETSLPIGGQKPSAMVYVWDRKTGNLASKSVHDASSAEWSVKPGDFQNVAEVSVHTEHAGKPVAAASVDLDDGRRKQTQLLTPSSNGAVTFFGVKPGSVKVTVHYKVADKAANPLTQLFDVSLIRTDPIPVLTISVADAVDTNGTPAGTASGALPGAGSSAPEAAGAAGKEGAGKPVSKESGGSVIGSIIVYLVVLGLIIGVGYFAWKYLVTNPDSVGSKLEALGVQIPKPGGDPLSNPAPMPMPKAPAPVQKIILDDAAPDQIAPVVASTVMSDPRLVSQNGDAMQLPEGELIVGREVGLGLSLVGESTVSRRHAQLTRTGSTVIVKDFGSTNGTFVNGVQLQGEKQLQIGDTVQFGSVRFRFEG